jgi:hypothetical protein
MATHASVPLCLADAPPIAADVARGVARLMFRADCMTVCEVSLGNGRRADIMAIDAKGCLTIVEIKVSRADLLGDMKWPDYLDYCDRFFWAVPPRFDLSPFETEAFQPGVAGLIVADRYDAVILREPLHRPMAAARRKAETLRFARRAARRMMAALDPELESIAGFN